MANRGLTILEGSETTQHSGSTLPSPIGHSGLATPTGLDSDPLIDQIKAPPTVASNNFQDGLSGVSASTSTFTATPGNEQSTDSNAVESAPQTVSGNSNSSSTMSSHTPQTGNPAPGSRTPRPNLAEMPSEGGSTTGTAGAAPSDPSQSTNISPSTSRRDLGKRKVIKRISYHDSSDDGDSTSGSTTGPLAPRLKKRKLVSDSDYSHYDAAETRAKGKPKQARLSKSAHRLHLSNDELSYTVEAIVGHRLWLQDGDDEKVPQWLIKWQGYDESENSWEGEECLLGCLELLAAYNKRENITVRGLTKAIEDSMKATHDQHGKTAKAKVTSPDGPVKLSGNLAKLDDLLDLQRLQQELETLQDIHLEAPPARYYKNHSDTTTTLNAIVEHSRMHNVLDSFISAVPISDPSNGGLLFKRMLHSIGIIPQCALDLRKMDIITRATLWEMCRSLVVVFSWCIADGPSTALKLLDTHHYRGYEVLKRDFPLFCDLVDHVVQYLHRIQDGKKQNKLAKRRKTGTLNKSGQARKQYSSNNETGGLKFGPLREDLEFIPQDMYGLLESSGTKTRKIALPKVKTVLPGIDALYEKASVCLQEIWSHELIIPQLRGMDRYFSTGRSKFTDEVVWERSITRGAILSCIALACGSDAIFASISVLGYLPSPALVFNEGLAKDSKFCKKVLADTMGVLEPLGEYIRKKVQEQPGLADVTKQIGSIVHQEVVALKNKGIPQAGITETLKTISTTMKQKKSSGKQMAHIPVTYERLLPQPNCPMPQVSLIALIVHEALNWSRKLPPGDERLQRIMLGQHAVNSSQLSKNPDHTNPIRRSMEGLTLLKHHLPPTLLTSKWGLANLLSWLGTGQGAATKGFLDQITDCKMFGTPDSQSMIQTFESRIAANARVVAQYPKNSYRSLIEIPGFVPADDMSVWGQPNNHLSITPTVVGQGGKKITVAEKINSYFSEKVCEAWMLWLGDLFEQDTTTYQGKLNTWKSALQLADDLGLPGFGPGLTQLQFANTLVFLHMVELPPPQDVGMWVFKHPRLGAFGGLKELGFSMWDEASTNTAFMCIYHHLRMFLTESDKQILGFDSIFVEHVLCKVICWTKLLWQEAGVKLQDIAQIWESQLSTPWIPGANSTDHTCSPIPLHMSMEIESNFLAQPV